jgi:hypothetical protein
MADEKTKGKAALTKIKLTAGRVVQGASRIIVQDPGHELSIPEDVSADEAMRMIDSGAAKRVDEKQAV